MKLGVMGAGGVGGYFGGRLAQGGHDVTFIARGSHLDAIRERGLRVESPHGDFQVTAHATDDLKKVGSVDVVLFCVKTWDTEEAGRLIEPMVGQDTVVLSLQNGVHNEEVLADLYGRDRVMAGVAYIASTIIEPAVVIHSSQMHKIVFGELDGEVTPRAEALLETFRASGVDVELSTDVLKVLWTKFLFICAVSGMTSITRAPVGDVLGCDTTRELFIQCMREVESLARARGVALDEGIVGERLAFADGLEHNLKSSMQRDLERGNRIEVGALNGMVMRYGDEARIPVPVNAFIYKVLKLADEQARTDARSS